MEPWLEARGTSGVFLDCQYHVEWNEEEEGQGFFRCSIRLPPNVMACPVYCGMTLQDPLWWSGVTFPYGLKKIHDGVVFNGPEQPSLFRATVPYIPKGMVRHPVSNMYANRYYCPKIKADCIWDPPDHLEHMAKLLIMQFYVHAMNDPDYRTFLYGLEVVMKLIRERGELSTDMLEMAVSAIQKEPWALFESKDWLLECLGLQDSNPDVESTNQRKYATRHIHREWCGINVESDHYTPVALMDDGLSELTFPEAFLRNALISLTDVPDYPPYTSTRYNHTRIRLGLIHLVIAYHVLTRDGVEESMRAIVGWDK